MAANLFVGQRVRLTALDPEKDAAVVAAWSRDPEFLRLLNTDSARPRTPGAVKKELNEAFGSDADPKPGMFPFLIRTLETEGRQERLVGMVDLSVDHWP